MTTPHDRAADQFRDYQALALRQLRDQAAAKPAHAAFLARLEAAVPSGEDAVLEAAEDLPSGVSATVADALADDLLWCHREPPRPGWFASGFPGAYRELLRRNRAAAVTRERNKQARAERSLESEINDLIFGRR